MENGPDSSAQTLGEPLRAGVAGGPSGRVGGENAGVGNAPAPGRNASQPTSMPVAPMVLQGVGLAASPAPVSVQRSGGGTEGTGSGRAPRFGTDGQELPEAPLRERCVIGFKGTINDAIEARVIAKPALMGFNAWQQWRAGPGMRPTAARGGRGGLAFTTPKEEVILWKHAMVKYYGNEWQERLRTKDEGGGEPPAAGPRAPPHPRPRTRAASHVPAGIFGGLVLGCIDADFCNQILILQHFSRSTK